MTNADFWEQVGSITDSGFTSEGLQMLDYYAEYLSMDGLYINDFHRSNSMAAQRQVQRMSLHPLSREQKLAQIAELHRMATISKENSNAERNKLNA